MWGSVSENNCEPQAGKKVSYTSKLEAYGYRL